MKVNKRGQEEIIGFILIVVIVAVVFLVFLGLSIRQDAPITQRDSGDASQFLTSAMEYTSECAISSDKAYVSLGRLISECYSDSKCRNGAEACDLLNRTLQEVIEANWKIGEDRPVRGYIFNSTYSSGSTIRSFVLLSSGNCTSGRIGAEHVMPAFPGSIRSSLELCS